MAKKAARVIVEFEDGSTVGSDFEALPSQLQFELMRQPFSAQPSADPAKEKYLYLEWEDGWKEVLRVDPGCSAINRYYVISRIEEVGRLSLDKEDGYPELVEITRRPMSLKKIHFTTTYLPELERSDREGKKTDHFFTLSKGKDSLADIQSAFKQACVDAEIDGATLRSTNSNESKKLQTLICKKMGLKAGLRTQDVADFIAGLAQTIK
ncbi:hypothetical protein DSCO28_65420 [Desulfosarcina ovata subsp. sediminis]|uniref:Uncharacterized protein n=1 Tax=Desulfosarcina ovata subsp. sediminis TaxID=885957 RepID=A0A5K8A0N4_9BACT|nr:hypothetical protein [Desulfosarcina ovata]BBO85976.1 hypothetical protein DSCO28_65420 [Desulfosarcina ovata subsp. sediminis]